MSIVWSCISIIILSTWSILHLDIPAHITVSNRRERICRAVYLMWRKIFWMALKVFSPEFAATGCMRKLLTTKSNSAKLEQWAYYDGVPWTVTHTILVDMGGIALRFAKDDDDFPNSDNGGHRDNSGQNNNIHEEVKEKDISLPDFVKSFYQKQRWMLQWCGKLKWRLSKAHVALAKKKHNNMEKKISETLNGEEKETIYFKNISKDIAALAGTIWILDSRQLAIARELGVIEKLPWIREEEINDKSKADFLVKLLAIIQILWLIVQLIVRRIHRVPFTQLEITTAAFAGSAIIIYAIDFVKPKDITVPFYVDVETVVTYEQFSAIVDAAPFAYMQGKRYYMPTSAVHDHIDYEAGENVLRKDCNSNSKCWCTPCKKCDPRQASGRSHCTKYVMSAREADSWSFLIGFVSATSFGGVHLFAWNAHFPTEVESQLWKIAALMIIFLPCLFIISHLFFIGRKPKTVPPYIRCVLRVFMLLIAICYVPCRLFLLAESFRSLYYLEPRAFKSTWAANIPHVG
ncbi:hypothetical protein PT974_03089 [Cladobotryum mycophilum]|uniref:Uncharacterized protein n=1 Tax=Cladobotryum mycophilum TaxID=491253 RepID=A0ABR0SWD0_9HYPO